MKAFRKVIPAIALLLISATILSTASYAWFTMSRQVTASGMDVTVTAPNNLLITAASDDSWAEIESISVTDVMLEPSSTVTGKDYFVLSNSPANVGGTLIDEKSILIAGTAALTAAEATVANGNVAAPAKTGAFYDFKYKVKTEGGTEVKVALSTLTISPKYEAVSGAGNENKVSYRGVTYETKAAADAADAVKNSLKPVRVAILTGAAENPTTVAKKNTGTGDNALYSVTSGANTVANKAIGATKAAGDTTESKRGDVKYTAVGTGTTDDIFTVPGDAALYVTIRVWFEGEDTSCTAALAAKAAFSVNAIFEAIG